MRIIYLLAVFTVAFIFPSKAELCDPRSCAAGRPGKRGPKGDSCNPSLCDDVDDKIDDRIKQALEELRGKVKHLEEKVEALSSGDTKKPTVAPKYPEGLCQVIYSGKCFWMIYNGPGVNYVQAKELCRKNNGGSLANIYDETHYKKIQDFVRSQMIRILNFYSLWIGMKYNPTTKQTTFTDGTVSTFQSWYPGTPFPINNDMIVWIARSPAKAEQGMWNYGRNTIHHGSLCEL